MTMGNSPIHKVEKSGALTVHGYAGDGAILLAFDLDTKPDKSFAGFAIKRTMPDGSSRWLRNRLTFDKPVTSATTPDEQHAIWTDSVKAPFQKFRWIDFSSDAGLHEYEVSAMYFGKSGLEAREKATIKVELGQFRKGKLRMGFTRGYVSSQAYANPPYNNDPISPREGANRPLLFATEPYQQRWDYLGGQGRKMVFDFLAEAQQGYLVDVFAYDLDEPDVIRQLQALGSRLRLFLDNASLHVGERAYEPQARKLLEQSGANVKVGHFRRFAHNKVIILRDAATNKAVKVLTGSANFSVRGLYVQSNSILIFDDPTTAGYYAQAFDAAFSDMSGFSHAPIAQGYFDVHAEDLSTFAVAFSPHKSASVSLDLVSKHIREATSSVMFAVMELGGGGDVLDELRKLPERGVFSYGVSQTTKGLDLYKPGSATSVGVPFAYLREKVAAPFQPFLQEISGGAGQVIHHKFVVVDFNGPHPALFCGSSNLASGGETSNGDNLIAFFDPAVAMAYAVEAVRLVDHYHFRVSMKNATDAKPLILDDGKRSAKRWWQDFWDPQNVKCLERTLFARGPSPEDAPMLATVAKASGSKPAKPPKRTGARTGTRPSPAPRTARRRRK